MTALQTIARNIAESGCLNEDDRFTGESVRRVVVRDSYGQPRQPLLMTYLRFEENQGESYVWIPEDCLYAAPMLLDADIEDNGGDTRTRPADGRLYVYNWSDPEGSHTYLVTQDNQIEAAMVFSTKDIRDGFVSGTTSDTVHEILDGRYPE